MDASLFFSKSFDLNILQSLSFILLLAIIILLLNDLLFLFKVHAFSRLRIKSGRVWPLKGLCKDVEGVLLLHC